ncbi:hypothetical protein L6164_024622 [Bauhinia variegata]|uniref:Uncharacterized protein n=1 Tax=Bauhinia variegata TaxID=167791 RepID=A0ACB9M0K5_BAUVA|nr:hypothetical protein L6164_024622 [Bauhinia variegata]
MRRFLLFLSSFMVRAWAVMPQQDQKNIFILAGQSNMAGRGGVINDTWDGVVPAECRPNPSILRLNAELKWVEAREPLHEDIDAKRKNGIGPGMAFANRILAEKPSYGVVGLVPCAIGGSNIMEWERGKVLYNHMMRRTMASLRNGNGSNIQALLWFQGEADTVNLHDAQSYYTRLNKFFSDVRQDLHSPVLPIIQVALASGLGPYIETVREAQLGMDLLNLRTVDAKGLSLEPDGLHLTTEAQLRLAHMMADAFLQFVPTPIHSSPHTPARDAATAVLPNSVSNFFIICLIISHIFITLF